MGSSSHEGERKWQLGHAVTVPMSGTHLKRDEGWDPTIKGAFYCEALSLPTESSSVGNESAPHCYKSPFAHGFELSRRQKKRAVGTCRNSTYEWAPT